MKKEIRRVQAPKGILVPLIERFMESNAVDISSPDDVKFLEYLATKMMRREEDRRIEGLGVFGPSSLGDPCLRKAYLTRHAVRPAGAPSPYNFRSHYFFLTGNFLHIKWQFVLYKLERWIANSSVFRVHGYEIPVKSKHGDHGGTIDALALIYEEPFVLDFQGLNMWSSKKVGFGNISRQYRTQVADYMLLWNSQRSKPFEVKRSLLVVEDKSAGKDVLQEAVITLAEDGRRARRRLEALRAHEAAGTIPAPKCKSLKDRNFTGCQFRNICHDEVAVTDKARTESMRAMLKDAQTTPQRISTVLKRKK